MSKFLSELRLYLCNCIVSKIPSHTLRLLFYRKVMKFTIGNGSTIFMNAKFDCAQGLTIGSNSVINANCRLDSRGSLEIGNNVSISEDVIILTADHNDELLGVLDRKKKVTICDYVWIGTRVMILPGVIVNRGGLIAAGSVVTRDVSELTVVGGVPAKKIKCRSENFNYSVNYKRLFQ